MAPLSAKKKTVDEILAEWDYTRETMLVKARQLHLYGQSLWSGQ